VYNQENKYCPNCGVAFECKVDNITQCQCFGVTLNSEVQQYLRKQFAGCICLNCLKKFSKKYDQPSIIQINKKPGHSF